MIRSLPFLTIASLTIAAVLAATPALARHVHHRTHAVRAAPYSAYDGYPNWQAALIARLTAKAQTEPGVTLELAPDATQTATGGPSGGVPGFSDGD